MDLLVTPADHAALAKLRDELFPGHTLNAVALKCMRDELIRCGLLAPGGRNRSRGARTTKPR